MAYAVLMISLIAVAVSVLAYSIALIVASARWGLFRNDPEKREKDRVIVTCRKVMLSASMAICLSWFGIVLSAIIDTINR